MTLVVCVLVFLILIGAGLMLLNLRPQSFRLAVTATRWVHLEVEMAEPITRERRRSAVAPLDRTPPRRR